MSLHYMTELGEISELMTPIQLYNTALDLVEKGESIGGAIVSHFTDPIDNALPVWVSSHSGPIEGRFAGFMKDNTGNIAVVVNVWYMEEIERFAVRPSEVTPFMCCQQTSKKS